MDTTTTEQFESIQMPCHASADQSFEVLEQLAAHWELRAGVKKPDINPEVNFDKKAPDFLPELLPFHNHDTFIVG